LGDWRVCVLTPWGSRVHAPWGLAIEARLAERFGPGAQVMWTDDGIVLRLPEAVETIPLETLFFEPDEIGEAIVEVVPGTALFASVFREAAARALLLPDPAGGHPRVPARSLRRAGAAGAHGGRPLAPRSGRGRRHRARVAVRAVAVVQVARGVDV
jgi:ATP-dependent Lhr-like helicase